MKNNSCRNAIIYLMSLLTAVLPCLFLSSCGIQIETVTVTAADAQQVILTSEAPTQPTTTEEPATLPPEALAPTEPETEPVTDEIEWTELSVLAESTTSGEIKNEAMKKLMDQLGPIVDVCGFQYDEQKDIFYSTMYPIQRFFGFNSLYDLASPRMGLIYNTQKIYFNCHNTDWMVQLWKGQYGITVGGEIGMYYKPETRLLRHYDCIEDSDMITMEFTLYKNGEEYFTRGPEKHWWLTGFKLLDVAIFLQLKMVATFYWEDDEIATAFVSGITALMISDISYVREGNTVTLTWVV